MIISLEIFYTFLILPSKLKKMKLETAEMSHFWKILITMCHLSVRKMKTAASWKKNDPILETRKIAL